MRRKTFIALCVAGMISTSVSMIWAAVEKQYSGSIFYLMLFIINAFGYCAAQEEI
jgi:hypothetical protein